MMEEGSTNHYQSFDQLLPDLKKLRQSTRKISSRKAAGFKHLLLIISMISILTGFAISIFLYFNPSYFQLLKDSLNLQPFSFH